MALSEIVRLVHWAIYIGSVLSLLFLFTRLRKWAAAWIGVLFASQAWFGGCLVVAWQNYYRAGEGLAPIANGLLTDRFSADLSWQVGISAAIAFIAIVIFAIESIKTNEK